MSAMKINLREENLLRFISLKVEHLFHSLVLRFSRLRKREKTLILLLIAAILFSVYFRSVFMPIARETQALAIELQVTRNRVFALKAQIPDGPKSALELESARKKLASLRDTLSEEKDKLPSQGRIPQFLEELVQQAAVSSIDLVAIKPKKSKDEGEYQKFFMELKLGASFKDAVNYMNQLETASKFMKPIEVDVTEIPEDIRGKIGATMTLSTLLSKVAGEPPLDVQKIPSVPELQLSRNPFASTFKLSKVDKKQYTLSGITMGKIPTAIINGEVYKKGALVFNQEILEIFPDRVMIGDKNDTLTLSLDDFNERK